jgi:tripartite-type tricarboxylate transporter receptor subunit TctC
MMLSPQDKISECVPRAALVVFACIAAVALAQEKPADYPNRPLRIVIGIAPGGGLDTITRVGAQKLSERWNQSVIVDNRPGGGSVIGMDIVAQAPADGYTLLGASDSILVNGVFKRVPYDVRKVFTPIVQMTSTMYAMVVNPSLPVRTVKELIAYARSKPGALSYGSQGLGSTGHLAMEYFKSMAGVDMVHVPYKGAAPAMIDIVSGQIHLMFASTVSSAPYIKNGTLRVIAVTGARRTPVFPDVPTISESGVPGFEWHNTYSLFAPAGTARAIIRAINLVVKQGINTPETMKYLAADGAAAAAPATPEEFKAKFAKDYDTMEKLVKATNLRIN